MAQRARDALVLLDLTSGRYYTVGGAGDQVWSLCDGQHTVRDIVAVVSDTYGATPAMVRADSIEILEHLRATGLVDDAS